jgi:hypothetical protein
MARDFLSVLLLKNDPGVKHLSGVDANSPGFDWNYCGLAGKNIITGILFIMMHGWCEHT